MTAPVRLVVVDDHPIVRSGLVALLSADPNLEVIGQAADGAEGCAIAVRERPDLVVMDLRMPTMDGVASTTAILAEWPEARILVLTTYDTDEAIVRAVEAGACGYLLKDTPPDELIDAVRRAAAGETVLAPVVAKRLVDRVRDPDAGALSAREMEVLREVARGNTNGEIATRLHISQATVKTHLLHIYDKLHVSDRAAAVAAAYESGILSPDGA